MLRERLHRVDLVPWHVLLKQSQRRAKQDQESRNRGREQPGHQPRLSAGQQIALPQCEQMRSQFPFELKSQVLVLNLDVSQGIFSEQNAVRLLHVEQLNGKHVG